jgi:mRNA interferase MazF
VTIARGAVVLVGLDPIVGREQGGTRPCIVVTPSTLVADQRYPILVIVPLTGTLGLGSLYPVLNPYPGGLSKASSALVDQIRAIDKSRVVKHLAPLPPADLTRVDEALRRALGL